jgi:glycosyltransferase involved in cell wall biosynthesis
MKYSIIIPTRNRCEYLKYAIQTVLEQKFTDFELIVVNNASTDGTQKYLESLVDHRLKIFHHTDTVSMTENFNFGLNQAKGEWITLFGDDDGLMPYFFEAAEIVITKFSAYEVIHTKKAHFYWPGVEKIYGLTNIFVEAKNTYEIAESKKVIKKFLSSEKTSYFEMPQFYTGTLFKNTLIQRLKNQFGNQILKLPAPDIHSFLIICHAVEKFVLLNLPLAWIGSSPSSNGFQHTKKNGDQSVAKDYDANNKNNAVVAKTNYLYLTELMSVQYYFLEAYEYTCEQFKAINWMERSSLKRHIAFIQVYHESKKKNLLSTFVTLCKTHQLNYHFYRYKLYYLFDYRGLIDFFYIKLTKPFLKLARSVNKKLNKINTTEIKIKIYYPSQYLSIDQANQYIIQTRKKWFELLDTIKIKK